MCHNTEATDIHSRTTPPFVDGKAETSIDFSVMIHSIHAAGMNGMYAVYHGSRATIFNSNSGPNWFPGAITNCYVCHADSWDGSAGAMNGTTTSTSGDPTKPAGFLRTTKTTAACGSCHVSSAMVDHFQQMGGHFGLTQSQIDALK